MPSEHLFERGRTNSRPARTLERMEPDQSPNQPGEQLVAALAAGEQQALAELYSTYSDRIYSYCVSVCKNSELAADATQDTFLLAFARAGQLRDPSKLRPWLYAIARNESLRQLRVHKREVDLDSAPEVADMNVTLDTGLDADDARGLIDAAFEGMNQSDREALDLALRQDLDNSSIAQVLGVSDNNAAAKVSRAKSQLEIAVGALLLFRTRKSGCAELRTAIGRDDAFNPLTRKRIARHAQDCPACSVSKSKAVAAIALAGLPLLVAPAALRGLLFNSAVPGPGTEVASGLLDGNPDGLYAVDQSPSSSSNVHSISDADLPQSQSGSQTAQSNPQNGSAPSTAQSDSAHSPDEAGQSLAQTDAPGQQIAQPADHAQTQIEADTPPQYIANNASKLPPLTLAEQAAQLEKKRPPFDAQGWPRKDDDKVKKWPFVVGGAAVIALLVAGTGSVLAGGTDAEPATQTTQPAATLQAPTTEAPADAPIPAPTTSKKPKPTAEEPSDSAGPATARPVPTRTSSSSTPTKRPTRSPSSSPATTTAPTPGTTPTTTRPTRVPRPPAAPSLVLPTPTSPIPQ